MSRRVIHSHRGVVTEWENEEAESITSVPSATTVLLPSASASDSSLTDGSIEKIDAMPSEHIEENDDSIDIDYSPFKHDSKVMEQLKSMQSTTEILHENKSKKLIFQSKREKWIFFSFIIPPLAISFISMLHIISLFETSNAYWMAVAIAISIELAAMSSLVALVTLNRLNRTTIWGIFGVLAILQIFGNMYHSYVNMSPESVQTILNLLAIENTPWSLRLVNFIVSGILPVISLTFVKGIVDYFKK